LVDADYENVKTEERLKIAKEIHDLAKAESDKIISVAAGYGDAVVSSFKAHSNGFSGHKEGTYFSTGAEVTVKDNDARPEDWFWVQSRFKDQFPSAEFIAKKAAQGALGKIGQAKIKSGTYNVIVENRAAMNLVSMLMSPMSASAIQQKSSYMDGMIGQAIASDKLTIIDNPFITSGLASRLFDGEGIASKERKVIEKGILQQYYIDSYYGKKLGLEPNGGSSSNLIFSTGNQSIDDLMKGLKNGIFLTGFNGGNSNSTTGDFSFGISGFYFENGKIEKPINEMNISGNTKEFWKQLTEVANDPYPYSKWQVPSLVFEGVNFSGL
jgi:PmbA protein